MKAKSFPDQTGTHQLQNQQSMDSSQEHDVEMLLLGKRRRGRRQSDFETYKAQTMTKMEEIESKMGEVRGSKKETKRLKNMISAYESRLLKRAKYEDLNEHLEIRNAQISSILKILKEELR